MNINMYPKILLGFIAVTALLASNVSQAFTLSAKRTNRHDYQGCDKDSPNFLMANFGLQKGACLVSPNGTAIAIYQPDGNFAIYRGNAMARVNSNSGVRFLPLKERKNVVIWSTHTENKQGRVLVMQGDGNLVNYKQGHAIWSTGVLHKPAHLILNDQAELTLHTTTNGMHNFGKKIGGWRQGVKAAHFGEAPRQFMSTSNKGSRVSDGWGGHAKHNLFVASIDLDRMIIEHNQADLSHTQAASSILDNCSITDGVAGETQESRVSLEASIAETTSFSVSASISLGVKSGLEVGNAAVGKVSEEVSMSISESFSKGKSTSNRKAYAHSANLRVRAGYKQSVDLIVMKDRRHIPYRAYYLVDGDYRKEKGKTKHGKKPLLTRISVDGTFTTEYGSTSKVKYSQLTKCD